MKVIVAGYSKTGTSSMAEALSLLGYSVYDYPEHCWLHYEQWMKIMKSGGTVEDFRKMYQNVDAVTDVPALYYWEQIHEAFPDSKIILLLRDEDSWVKSFVNMYEQENNDWNRNFGFYMLSPSDWKMKGFDRAYELIAFGIGRPSRFQKTPVNELSMRIRYRMHNNYVLTKAPKDKLLVFNIKDGWKPLCRFLGKSIPDMQFPHKNKGHSQFRDLLEEKPFMKRIETEATISFCLLVIFGTYGVVKLCRSNVFGRCANFLQSYFSSGIL